MSRLLVVPVVWRIVGFISFGYLNRFDVSFECEKTIEFFFDEVCCEIIV